MSQSVFERYQYHVIHDKIGEGAFGKVFRAYDKIRDRYVALKVSEVININGKEFSLENELRAISDIPLHKNIAFYESIEKHTLHNGIFEFAIMQYYPAGSLRELLLRPNKIGQNDKVHLIQGITEGLHHLHSYGIIHRDLKPSNVLIVSFQDTFIPKITDFGLSKKITNSDNSFTSNSFLGGTLDYASPEQLTGQSISKSADLWALGVLFYEILCGKKVFQHNSSEVSNQIIQARTIQNILECRLPADIQDIQEPFRNIITQCLKPDPKQRPSSTSEILKLLLNADPPQIENIKGIDSENFTDHEVETQIFSYSSLAAEINKINEKNGSVESESSQNEQRIHAQKLKEQEELRIKQEQEFRLMEELELQRKHEDELRLKQEQELQRKQQEELRLIQEQEYQRKQEEELRLKQEQELQRKQQEELRLKQEQELQRKQEEELLLKQEQELQRKHQEELRLKQEQELQRKQEEELRLKQEQELQRKQEEELRLKQEQELWRKQQEELRLKQEQELQRKQQEELRLKQEQELQRKQQEELRLKQEQELQRKQQEEILRKREKVLQTSKINETSIGVNTGSPKIKKSKRKYVLVGLLLILIPLIGIYSISRKNHNGNSMSDLPMDSTAVKNIAITADMPIEEIKKSDQSAQEWGKIANSTDITDYERFLKKFPASEYSDIAKSQISNLMRLQNADNEKEAWKVALDINSPSSYQNFLERYPKSELKAEAQSKLNKFAEEEKIKAESDAYNLAMQSDDVDVLENFKRSYPDSKKENDINSKLNLLKQKKAQSANEGSNGSIPSNSVTINVEENKQPTVVQQNANILPEKKEALVSEVKSEAVAVPLAVQKIESMMVSIPSGSYKTNCEDCKKDGINKKINGFKILESEVTQELYIMVMGKNPSDFSNCNKCPVENISFQDAVEFIEKVNSLPGNKFKYRLPSESEWEYAALAGNETKYAGSDEADLVAWFKINSKRGTQSSKGKQKNNFGLYGMSGNVGEWCREKVVKGGSWNDNVNALEVRKKASWPSTTRNPFIGFRIIRE